MMMLPLVGGWWSAIFLACSYEFVTGYTSIQPRNCDGFTSVVHHIPSAECNGLACACMAILDPLYVIFKGKTDVRLYI